MLEKFGARCERLARAYMPDPFVLVLLLTTLTFALCLWLTPTQTQSALRYWNSGFWELLSFAMQMALIVVTGEAVADAPLLQAVLRKIAAAPKSARSAVWGLAFASIVLGWFHWGFGLIFASLTARKIAQSLQHRKISVHYPILGVAAYMSMLLWHAGSTATAPLLINTPGHFLEKEIGLVPLRETILLPSNLLVCIFLAIAIPFLVLGLMPRRGIRTIDEFDVPTNPSKRATEEKAKTFAEKLERSYVANGIVGTLGVVFLIRYFREQGPNLNHNIINLLFLSLGLLLHRSPTSYSRSIAAATKGTSGILLQFPFYGGIMGLMRESGLGHEIATLFLTAASAKTLPLFAYLASVFTKLFIPSGGGEWAVEGPVVLAAAKQLGAPIGLTTMGIAYGNMVGNMFQPFWAIPLLSVMGLHARDIMGYCLVVFLAAFPVLAIALLFP